MEALSRKYNWDDYLTLPEGERHELINGRLYSMSPGPSIKHQELSMRLSARLFDQARESGCRLFAAPTDLKLSEQDVVQPDLMVVCQPGQIQMGHVEGAPTLIVEILSPSTQAQDRVRKLHLYAKSGVKEYWLIQPECETVEVLHLREGSYAVATSCTKEDEFRSPSFPSWQLDLTELFGDTL
jgi:Uma2 family endonuclease